MIMTVDVGQWSQRAVTSAALDAFHRQHQAQRNLDVSSVVLAASRAASNVPRTELDQGS
jgi:hypothetical protein